MVRTDGVKLNVYIQGGIWGFEWTASHPEKTWTPAGVTFTPDPSPGNPLVPTSYVTFSGAGAPSRSDFAGYAKAFSLEGVASDPNNKNIFVFGDSAGAQPPASLPNKFRVLGAVMPDGGEGPISGFTVRTVPPAGPGMAINSPGGVVRDVKLVKTRGVMFQIAGDGLELSGCTSKDVPFVSGGGVQITSGLGIRCFDLDIDCSDDCFQFIPNDKATVARCSFVNCVGTPTQGSLIAFSNGGRNYTNPIHTSDLNDCFASNIRGIVGGSVLAGGTGIKFYCANSDHPLTNCWAENIYIQQLDLAPRDSPHGTVKVIVGRDQGGVVNCGVRNIVSVNRTGPLLLVDHPDRSPDGAVLSNKVDFSLEQAKAIGQSSVPGSPLVAVPFGDRIILRDVVGELSAADAANSILPGRALQIGCKADYAFGNQPAYNIPAGHVEELVIDGFKTTVAARPSSDGIWQFGDVGTGSIRRLGTTLMPVLDPTPTPKVGGIEMVTANGNKPQNLKFSDIDFRNLYTGMLGSADDPDKRIVTWLFKDGNEIERSIGLDDFAERVYVDGNAAAAPLTLARPLQAVFLNLRAGPVTSATFSSMNGGVSPSPKVTLIVPANITITGSSADGGFLMGTNLTGGSTATITFQWKANSKRWQEVARTS